MKTLSVIYALIFGKENMNDSENPQILNSAIEHILSTKKFNADLFE